MFYVILFLIYPFLFVANVLASAYAFIVDRTSSEKAYSPTFREWMILGRKNYLQFRDGLRGFDLNELKDARDWYGYKQAHIDEDGLKSLIDRLLPTKWLGVYMKACEYELERRSAA